MGKNQCMLCPTLLSYNAKSYVTGENLTKHLMLRAPGGVVQRKSLCLWEGGGGYKSLLPACLPTPTLPTRNQAKTHFFWRKDRGRNHLCWKRCETFWPRILHQHRAEVCYCWRRDTKISSCPIVTPIWGKVLLPFGSGAGVLEEQEIERPYLSGQVHTPCLRLRLDLENWDPPPAPQPGAWNQVTSTNSLLLEEEGERGKETFYGDSMQGLLKPEGRTEAQKKLFGHPRPSTKPKVDSILPGEFEVCGAPKVTIAIIKLNLPLLLCRLTQFPHTKGLIGERHAHFWEGISFTSVSTVLQTQCLAVSEK